MVWGCEHAHTSAAAIPDTYNSPPRPHGRAMVNTGFPKFGSAQSTVHVSALRNYNLPDFVLRIVARDCGSELLEKGRIDERLQSMNRAALDLLHRAFVECEDDAAGKFAQLRFYAYVSSMYHKCEVAVNEAIPGASGRNHKVPIAVKSSGMYVAVATNKPTGNPVNKRDAVRFYKMVDDLKSGDHGTQLLDAIYASSVGFKGEALLALSQLSKLRMADPESRLDFKTANFENNIYSLTQH